MKWERHLTVFIATTTLLIGELFFATISLSQINGRSDDSCPSGGLVASVIVNGVFLLFSLTACAISWRRTRQLELEAPVPIADDETLASQS